MTENEMKAKQWARLAASHLLAAVGDINGALLDDVVGTKFILGGVQERINKATELLMRARVMLEAEPPQAQCRDEEEPKGDDEVSATSGKVA